MGTPIRDLLFGSSRGSGNVWASIITNTVLGVPDCKCSILVAEWMHFRLFGIILPTINLKVYTFWGL